MKKMIYTLILGSLFSLLVSCSSDQIQSACPNFGDNCVKTPINSWNFNQ